MYYDWLSKEFDFTRPVNFGAYIVKMAGETVDETEAKLILFQAYNDARIATRLHPVNFSAVNSSRYVNVGTTPAGIDLLPQTSNSIGGSSLHSISDVATVSTAVILRVYAGRRLVYTANVTPNMLGRLPSGFKEHVWQFELTGNDDIYSLAVAEVPKELINV